MPGQIAEKLWIYSTISFDQNIAMPTIIAKPRT